ncbi:toxin-like protein 14 [Parasteatoda tepidariorum]|uniref:toxin-like protein 14 n=1 Tax=Parasteatoda tepidariorum TaxID=114398 RepID=UPI001C725010|nr:toxin-like protein 14 [Parasteatoda tepidariorum]XP_042908099.1 toxin-like protein 14 [Parasteatoda tepidariorum]XP_042908100.1 toxin-like protein 14 [Parasteatoda tepidariorum]
MVANMKIGDAQKYWFTFLVIYMLFLMVNAYDETYVQELDTENGYCDTEEFGQIPVYGEEYDDNSCRVARCGPGRLLVDSCVKVAVRGSKCRIVKGEGHYPHCCPRPECS